VFLSSVLARYPHRVPRRCQRLRLISWCDRNNVDYLIGIRKNSRLLKDVDGPTMFVRNAHWELVRKCPPPTSSNMGPASERILTGMVAPLEEDELAPNSRFIFSSCWVNRVKLYYKQYCARGDMENRSKDQLSLFADRTSNTH